MGPIMACWVDRSPIFLRTWPLIGPHMLIIPAIDVNTFLRIIRTSDVDKYHVGRINGDTTARKVARIPSPKNVPPKPLDNAMDPLAMV